MTIRSYHDSDAGDLVRLSLRAWVPVFASLEQMMDDDVYRAFYIAGWRKSQRTAVEAALAEQGAWVAKQRDATVGFVTVVLHREDSLSEIHMLAVYPDYQGQGTIRH